MSDLPVVVTGASGPLAQEVIELLSRRHPVIGVTRRTSTEGLYSSPGIVYEGWQFLKQPGPRSFRAFMHLAAHVDFSPTLDNVVSCAQANVLRTAEIVQFCQQRSVPRLVYASTVSIYRDDGQSPKTERSPVGPSSAYAASKWMGELAVEAARGGGLETVVLRFAGIYGQRHRRHPALNHFIQQALQGEPIRVSAPDAKRDYVYFKDAARAASLAVESSASGVFHVASGVGITLRKMAQQVCRIIGGNFEILPAKECQASSELVFDVSGARKHLNFECQYNLAEALKDIQASVVVS